MNLRMILFSRPEQVLLQLIKLLIIVSVSGLYQRAYFSLFAFILGYYRTSDQLSSNMQMVQNQCKINEYNKKSVH